MIHSKQLLFCTLIFETGAEYISVRVELKTKYRFKLRYIFAHSKMKIFERGPHTLPKDIHNNRLQVWLSEFLSVSFSNLE